MQAWRKVMAAYCRVYDSRHVQADCQEPESAPEPTLLIEYGLSFIHTMKDDLMLIQKSNTEDAPDCSSSNNIH